MNTKNSPSRYRFLKAMYALATIVALGLSGCSSPADKNTAQETEAFGSSEKTDSNLQTVSVILDWTPNTNHTGIYVAQQQGLYEKAGLKVEIQGYSKAGVEAVLSNNGAQFGFTGLNGVAQAHAGSQDIKIVYNLQQRASNGISVMESSPFQRPKDLDGKIFATYGADDAGAIVRKVIQGDGGKGHFETIVVGTGSYEAVVQGRADFAEGLTTWEGLEYKLRGKPLRFFYPDDYGVQTSPCLIGIGTTEKLINDNPKLVEKFIRATKQGYDYALQHPEEAAKILVEANPQAKINAELAIESQKMLAEEFWKDSRGETGLADLDKWKTYLNYMSEEKLITDPQGNPTKRPPNAAELVTNEFVR
ncbi:MAG: ABC transporter substrate-binding protein [Actinomycetaceae bacterium]|nr:ABC transporter substrate-binding protein [Actinomycetaceae bacterium]